MKKGYILLTSFAVGLIFIRLWCSNELSLKKIDAFNIPVETINLQQDIVKTNLQKTIFKSPISAITKFNIESSALNSIDTLFKNSENLFLLAMDLLEVARSGDPVAQFYLAKILLTCSGSIELLNRERSVIETNLEMEITDWYGNRCAAFNYENIKQFGSEEQWIKLSAKSSYGPAVVVELIGLDEVPKEQGTLLKLQSALESNQYDVMLAIATLGKDKITSEAWDLLACDYGYDCSADSKEDWRIRLAAGCALERSAGLYCDAYIDYKTAIKKKYSESEFEGIINRKAYFAELLKTGQINQFILEDFLN